MNDQARTAPAAPPIQWNEAAEQSVIGGVLLHPPSFFRVSDRVSEKDFFRRDHQMLWRAICILQDKGEPPDAVTLGEWFQSQRIDQLVGRPTGLVGASYILELANTTPSAANITAYADIVREKAILRRLSDASVSIHKLATYPEGLNSQQVCAEAQRLIMDSRPADMAAITSAEEAVAKSLQKMQDRYHAKERITGLRTGISSFDERTHGLQPGKVYMIAGRPSMGKSAVVCELLLKACEQPEKGRPALFTMEMPADEWTDRMLANVAGVNLWKIGCPKDMDQAEWTASYEAVEKIRDRYKFPIDDSATQTIQSLTARAMQMHAQSPLSMIVIDHLGLFDIDEEKNTARQIGLITKGLKALSKRLGVPIVLLVQLNRSGGDNPPVLKDMRESGRIEEDADCVVMLHRPGYYEEDNGATPKGYCEAYIRKLRGGIVGKLTWFINFAYMRTEDTDPFTPPPKQEELGTTKRKSKSKGWEV
jgi:replicative DNA helicase